MRSDDFLYLLTSFESTLDSVGTVASNFFSISVALILLLGICLGWLSRSFVAWRYQPLKHSSSKQVDEENRKAIMKLVESDKRLLKAVATKGEVYCGVDDWSCPYQTRQQLNEQFIEFDTVEGNRLKMTATPLLQGEYEKPRELLAVFSDQSIQERVVFDPEKRKAGPLRFSLDHEFSWWRYTSDSKVLEEQEQRLMETSARQTML